jgi:predicted Zn-dependent protease with MMP-like domain
MTDEAFEQLVARGLDALPPSIHAKMKNVAVVIADAPTEEQLRAHGLNSDETLFGLYEGVPQTERGVEYVGLPDKISIFKNPILETYSDPRDIEACVENTVWHEVAHHFGMDEAEVESEEIKRGKTV